MLNENKIYNLHFIQSITRQKTPTYHSMGRPEGGGEVVSWRQSAWGWRLQGRRGQVHAMNREVDEQVAVEEEGEVDEHWTGCWGGGGGECRATRNSAALTQWEGY